MRRPVILAVLALLSACAAGPDYRAPAAPDVKRLTATPLPASTADGAQHFVEHADLPPQWWNVFGSAELDALVERSLKNNPSIAAAEAALRQAQELASAQRAAFFPQVDASYSPQRARVAEVIASPLSSGASVYTLHTAQLNVTYNADVFGANRRAVESLDEQAQSQLWQLRAARLTLAANVVNAALQEASLREQMAMTARWQAIAGRQLELMKVQQRLGAASGADVLAQEVLLRQVEASAAVLAKQLAQTQDQLAALLGETPDSWQSPAFTLGALTLPDVPTTLPGQVLAQRPDVRIAEAQLHAANAELGVAVANMLPQISLSANYGASATSLGQLFRAGGLAWGLGASLTQPLFQGGELLHRKRAAEAQLDQALAQYRSIVLGAFQNVADALEAARHDADQQLAASRQEAAGQRLLAMAQEQLALGDISRLSLLGAEANGLQATLSRIQAQAARLSDVVGVYQSLGGGWQGQGLLR